MWCAFNKIDGLLGPPIVETSLLNLEFSAGAIADASRDRMCSGGIRKCPLACART